MGNFNNRFNKLPKLPDDVDDGLETLEEYQSRWRSVRVIYFTMFLMSLGFSIILTGIWPYLNKLDPHAGKEFMGLIVAANPLGQMIFSPLFGWWSNKIGTIRLPLLCSIVLFTVASGLYSSLEMRPDNVKYWMLISRFLIGVSSSNIAVCRSYLSAATRLSERTKAVSMVSLAQVLGFIVGPGMQTAVTPLGNDGYSLLSGFFVFNMYTACGWINVIMSIGNFIMFLPGLFEEHKIAAREIMIKQGKSSERETWKAIKPDYVSAWTLIMAFFVLVFNFVLLETLGTSLTMDQFAWSNHEALYYMGILMSVGAIVSLVTFVAINPLCKMFPEHYVLIWGGFSLMVLGRVLYIPWGDSPPTIAEVYNVTIPLTGNATIDLSPDDDIFLGCPSTQPWCERTPALTLTQFIIGYAFTSIGYPIGVTLIQTIFSKVLGPRPQGVWMGLMTGAGCLSRVLGPVFVGVIYTRYGTYWTFGITSVMMLVAMIWLLLSKKRLIPPSFDNPLAGAEMQTLSTSKMPLPSVEGEYKIVAQSNEEAPALSERDDDLDTALNTALCANKNNITIVVAEK
ncbi:major facilitator superfamily domain-containing protein 8-like isoform X1 [Rhagoletis pomonella]|uniref:major facilitator superfamily domain-containing protein 8-like isoform X1 n=2 Tax=Rhagoletis pomonella TaxID=28610 RepID=UPI00177C234B|nr:major facilitator superfamily domain-containing protein 8-like isoform X1 [Rhagoletis pomonella]XP_036325799.1 major facilitator superfamily domain-containing protein 8-like isoform X1 [Rhagoletis pomonella]XP_036325800.1 major facilitator superfamily domain-containing protein 8-like isoform X1 [Rhagoletis pomonella]XP_036325801.1 major facilitator superfamily domain-containing protein 8-like isoform X1 [Rhagoletis pomonella]XP_036325802.1 major facilitator superfamily domain-containing prot